MASDRENRLTARRGKGNLDRSIAGISGPLAERLADLGLPIDNVLATVDERRKVSNGLEAALAVLDDEHLENAQYLSKFTVAVAVGLFDGALNYLWNETVAALQALVARTDLAYFFTVAEKVNSKNKDLSSEDDLAAVQDHDLLETCRRVGLLSNVNYQRLQHVNYMRNHASAAHPNEQEIDGHELLGFLSVCLKHVITAEPDPSVVTVTRLLENIRTQIVPEGDFVVIAAEVKKLKQERIDDLLWTVFGLFVDPKVKPEVKANVQGLAPWLWNEASEDRRYEIGARFGVYRKNADVARKNAADQFLSVVGGKNFKDEDSLTTELIEKLDALKAAHFGFNNFYNEYSHAQALGYSVPPHGRIPRAARPAWVKVLSLGYVGNGLGYRSGVDERALPYYEKFISQFGDAEIREYTRLFEDPEFSATLGAAKTDSRARTLAATLQASTETNSVKKALQRILDAPAGSLPKLAATTVYKTALAATRT